jgi:hypothetical protein
MAVIGSFTQQPADKLDYDVDYSEWLQSGDSVLSTVVTAEPTGLTLADLIVGSKVKVWVSGGVNLTKYKITVTTTTALDRIKQDELKVSIKET